MDGERHRRVREPVSGQSAGTLHQDSGPSGGCPATAPTTAIGSSGASGDDGLGADLDVPHFSSQAVAVPLDDSLLQAPSGREPAQARGLGPRLSAGQRGQHLGLRGRQNARGQVEQAGSIADRLDVDAERTVLTDANEHPSAAVADRELGSADHADPGLAVPIRPAPEAVLLIGISRAGNPVAAATAGARAPA